MNIPYDGLAEVAPSLKHLDSIPLTGGAPPFPWEALADRLTHALGCKELQIQPREFAWRSKESLYENLGDSPFLLTFSVPILHGEVYWVMPLQEVTSLVALVLTHQVHSLQWQEDAHLIEGMYRFLVLEALYHFSQLAPDRALTPMLVTQSEFSEQDALCRDISVVVGDRPFWGRLILLPTFREAWVNYFAQKQAISTLSQQMTQCISRIIHVEAGRVSLSPAEWRSLRLGDVILLDVCQLHPDKLEGRVTLTIDGRPTFRARLKEGALKISAHVLLHEVDTAMAISPEGEEKENPADWALPNNLGKFDDESLFADLETDDLFAEEEGEATAQTPDNSSPTQAKSSYGLPEQTDTPLAHHKGPVALEDIPMTLTVEVGQIELTMDQLLKLEPGNLLDVTLHPRNGVDLTVNGRIVGKGELIRIGETLGVRILQVGRSESN